MNKSKLRGYSLLIALIIGSPSMVGNVAYATSESHLGGKMIPQLEKTVGAVLKESGFKQRGLSWYRDEGQSILAVDLQLSKYSPGPYINFGVYYKRFGNLEEPDVTDCQIQTRLEALVPDPLRAGQLTYTVLGTITGAPVESPRENELKELIQSYGRPWLESLSVFENAKQVLAQQKHRAIHIVPNARPELD